MFVCVRIITKIKVSKEKSGLNVFMLFYYTLPSVFIVFCPLMVLCVFLRKFSKPMQVKQGNAKEVEIRSCGCTCHTGMQFSPRLLPLVVAHFSSSCFTKLHRLEQAETACAMQRVN